jgi:hypothetical protein
MELTESEELLAVADAANTYFVSTEKNMIGAVSASRTGFLHNFLDQKAIETRLFKITSKKKSSWNTCAMKHLDYYIVEVVVVVIT